MTHVTNFLLDVFKIWQIRAKISPNLSNLQNVEQKNLSNYQNEARDWLFEEKIRIRILVRNCQIFKTNAYQITWKLPPSNGFCQISQYTPYSAISWIFLLYRKIWSMWKRTVQRLNSGRYLVKSGRLKKNKNGQTSFTKVWFGSNVQLFGDT